MQAKLRQLVIDTETTGLSVVNGDRIIEFAALEVIDRQLTGNKLHLYINPERSIDAEATRIHGITNEIVRDKPIFAEVAPQIIEFISGAQLIIHNAKFDIGFLDWQLKSLNLGLTEDYATGVVDTLLLARQKYAGSRNSLDALCDRFEVDRSNRDYHGALIDCNLLYYVYLGLTKEQVSLLGDTSLQQIKSIRYEFKHLDTSKLNLKVIHPSADELELHHKLLQKLDKASHGSSAWFNILKE